MAIEIGMKILILAEEKSSAFLLPLHLELLYLK